MNNSQHIIIIGAGIGGLSAAALLANAGYHVTVFESQAYPGGCAGTFNHAGYRFDAGATVAGGFQSNGPHGLLGQQLGIEWPIQEHDPAWTVHLHDRKIKLTKNNQNVLEHFPESERFWKHQSTIADLGWSLSSQGLPWPPSDLAEIMQLVRIGISNFPADLSLAPLAFRTALQWIGQHGLASNHEFVRFIDAQLLISAQTTSGMANAIYSATALDLARQGVNYVKGGIGGLADTLVTKIKSLGGEVYFKHRVVKIHIKDRRAVGVSVTRGRRSTSEDYIPADFVIANVTPWSLDLLLNTDSPSSVRREAQTRTTGYGAFVLHIGVAADKLPPDLNGDHHQIILDQDGPLGETRSLFLSMSPEWDKSRAPEGRRAITVTTHTQVQQWWDWLSESHAKYTEQKRIYESRMVNGINTVIPGFSNAIELILPGSPVTYEFYTQRHKGVVGGFPQRSLLSARGPQTGISNIRLVGDSIFPGQSTAGVTLGAMRVVKDILRSFPPKILPDQLHQLHYPSGD